MGFRSSQQRGQGVGWGGVITSLSRGENEAPRLLSAERKQPADPAQGHLDAGHHRCFPWGSPEVGSLVPSWWQGAGVWGRMSGGEGISDPASLQGPGARGHGAHLPKPRRATVCVSAQLHPVGHPVGGLQSARYKYLHHPPRECRSQALPAPSPPRGLVVKHSPATLLGTSIGYLSY